MLVSAPKKCNDEITCNWACQVYHQLEEAKALLVSLPCKYVIFTERTDDGPRHLDIYMVLNHSMRASGIRRLLPMVTSPTPPYCPSYIIIDYLKSVALGNENVYERGIAPRQRRPTTVFTVGRETVCSSNPYLK